MSSCTIYEFHNGIAEDAARFGNSWGGAMRVWTVLYDKYLKDPHKEYDNVLSGDMDKLWQLWKRPGLLMCERVVLVGTFDRAIVRREHFAEYAGHLREFKVCFPAPDGAVDHLWAWSVR